VTCQVNPGTIFRAGARGGVHFGRLYPVRSGVDDEVWGPNDMDGFDAGTGMQVAARERPYVESSRGGIQKWPHRPVPPSLPCGERLQAAHHVIAACPLHAAARILGTCQPVIGLVTRRASHLTFITPKRTKRSIRGPPDLDLFEEMVHVDGHGFLTSTSKPTVRSLHARLA
jgi:hypothetical protein